MSFKKVTDYLCMLLTFGVFTFQSYNHFGLAQCVSDIAYAVIPASH